MKKGTILILDDESGVRELLEILFESEGYDVTSVGGCDEFREEFVKVECDAVITDLRIGRDKEAGMKILEFVKDSDSSIPVIMITAYGSEDIAVRAMKLGAYDYQVKPFKSNDEIKLKIAKAIEERRIRQDYTTLLEQQRRSGSLERFVGSSKYLVEAKSLIRKIGPLSSTVLISGESGTGKELISRAIHSLSNRSDRPFVAVNCGGIPETLLESELFGHTKGAFTGAVSDKKGLFESADGGSLFLDELGETSPSFQVKLLRVLDEHVIKPVGSTVSKKVDVRVIAATNKNLEEMVAEGTFRDDLYYRLNVIPVRTVPLRERKEDIAVLANHFLPIYNKELNRDLKGFSREAIVILEAYPWPGNIRELRNVTERAVALSPDALIQPNDLPEHMQIKKESDSTPVTATLTSTGIDLEANTARIEKNLIRQALDFADGSHKQAAELLNLTPRTLRYRLQKYDLDSK